MFLRMCNYAKGNSLTMSRRHISALLLSLMISSLGVSSKESLKMSFTPDQTAWYTEERIIIDCSVFFANESDTYTMKLLHNNSIIEGLSISEIHVGHDISNPSINDSGNYMCIIENKPHLNISYEVRMIDINLIDVPTIQYAYINTSVSLKYASEYEPDNITWMGPNSKVHNGTIEYVTLESEGQHNCTMTIMGAPKDWPVDVFVIEPPTIEQVPPLIQAKTTDAPYVVKMFYTGRAPLGGNISLFKDGVLIDLVHFSNDLANEQTSIQVYQRNDAGIYTVIVETERHPGAEPPYELTDKISFSIEVLIPPKLPPFTVDPGTHSCLISWDSHNQVINPEAVIDEVILMLFNSDSEVPLGNERLNASSGISSYEFTNLVPASKYKFTISVKNCDGEDQLDSPKEFTTEEAAPSISSFTLIRTNSLYFSATLTFNYLGADDAFVHKLCYRPTDSVDISAATVCDNTTEWQRDHLTWKTKLDLKSSADISVTFSFKVIVSNTASFLKESEWVTETTVSLGPPSQPSFVSISSNDVNLTVQLPTIGTPPILKYEFTLSSDSAPSIVTSQTGVFESGERVTMYVGGSDGGEQLLSSTKYQVTCRAYNLAGWSPNSPENQFTTLVHIPLPPTEIPPGVETWVIVLAVVLPSLTCLVLIIASIVFFYLQRRYKIKKNGYPITPATAGVASKFAHSPGEQRCVRPYFSNNGHLIPRPPTAEPQFLNYPFAQIDRHDSDSEATDNRAPCYKYVVSPTPEEIGVKGFLGTNPGSGTFVYV